MFKALHQAGVLPPHPRVLELGESEWYGDVPPDELHDLIDAVAPGARQEALHRRLDELLDKPTPYRGWDLAKLFYLAILDYREIVAIDFHGTPAAKPIDLNGPVELGGRFDLVIDGGTAEHVFNVYQFFRTCHEIARPGGLIVHHNPFRGWLEHGFYNFNPTFYWDLAAANNYDLLMMVYTEVSPVRVVQLSGREQIIDMARAGELGANAMLYAVYRKDGDAPFAVPTQGFYAKALSDQMVRAWHDVR